MSKLQLRKYWSVYLYWLKKEIFFMTDFVALKIFHSLLFLPLLWLCLVKDKLWPDLGDKHFFEIILWSLVGLWFAREILLWLLSRREYYKAGGKERLSYMAITTTTPFYLPARGLYLGEFENIEKAYSAARRKLSIQYKVIGVVAVDYECSIGTLLK